MALSVSVAGVAMSVAGRGRREKMLVDAISGEENGGSS
jgi:hypothetical protein